MVHICLNQIYAQSSSHHSSEQTKRIKPGSSCQQSGSFPFASQLLFVYFKLMCAFRFCLILCCCCCCCVCVFVPVLLVRLWPFSLCPCFYGSCSVTSLTFCLNCLYRVVFSTFKSVKALNLSSCALRWSTVWFMVERTGWHHQDGAEKKVGGPDVDPCGTPSSVKSLRMRSAHIFDLICLI